MSETIKKLVKTIRSRKGGNVKSSYTSFLLSKGNDHCLNKLKEEVSNQRTEITSKSLQVSALEKTKKDLSIQLSEKTDRLDSLQTKLTQSQAKGLIYSNVVAGGMIPKLDACLVALKNGGVARIVDGRKPHALIDSMSDKTMGTCIS